MISKHMESPKSRKSHVLLSVVILLLSSFILLSHSLAPPGTIERVTKQQFLASLPPSEHDTGSSQLFLTSPSGKYAVYLLRRETTLGAGGFGTDFCYLQVQESGVSVWESECTPVSNVNTCTLLFSEAGLEIFDGSQSAWDNDVDGENLETLVLMDSGDMQIRDKDGELVWKASDNPIVNQNCGSIGAPGLNPVHPPFGSPIHDGRGPFGQPAAPAAGSSRPGQQQPQTRLEPDHQLGAYSQTDHQQQQQQQEEYQQQQQQQQEPAASPHEEQHSQQQEPAASPDQEEHQPQQEPAGAPEEHPQQQQQQQQEPAASPEQEHQHQHQHQHQQQLGSSPEEVLNNKPSSSLNPHDPIGVRNQQPYSNSLNQQQQQQQQPIGTIPIGVANSQQPLIDNTPFDSGSSRENPFKFGVTMFFLISTLMGFLF